MTLFSNPILWQQIGLCRMTSVVYTQMTLRSNDLLTILVND